MNTHGVHSTVLDTENSGAGCADKTKLSLQKQLTRLEKEEEEVERELTDYGWKLDHTSQVTSRLKEESRDLQTQLDVVGLCTTLICSLPH